MSSAASVLSRATPGSSEMQITVATFNIRNITDRYEERRPLLVQAFAGMAPQIAGLQEVIFSGDRQDDLLAAAVPHISYTSIESRSPNHRNFGNSILSGVGVVQAQEELKLSNNRAVQRALILLPGQQTLWFANTHLHHRPLEPEVRKEQAEAMCAWMAAAPAADAVIITGDFNAPPFEAAYAVMRAAGYRSAFLEANGAEPAVTWPSGIQAETMDTDGDPNCLDYIWLGGNVRAASARLAANDHPPGDSTIYPSDHFAIVAEVKISR